MSNEYIQKEITKIISQKKFPLNYAMASAWILGNFKAYNLKVYDVSNESSLADYFVIATANNIVQAQAMAEEIGVTLKNHGTTIRSKEGQNGSDWILLDLGDVIVHIFVSNAREIYNLDALWNHRPSIEIPQDYYMSDEQTGSLDTAKGYF